MGMKRVGVKRLPDGARPWSVRVTWEERAELERVLAGLRASVVVEAMEEVGGCGTAKTLATEPNGLLDLGWIAGHCLACGGDMVENQCRHCGWKPMPMM